MMNRKRERQETKDMIRQSVLSNQNEVASTLIQDFPKKLCIAGSVSKGLSLEVLPRTHTRIIPKQMSIDTALAKPVVHGSLRSANNARLTTAIADLCHAENLPDRVVGCARFQEVIDAAKMVGADWRMPSRKDIGGSLLKVNAAAYKKGNFDDVTKDGPKFGYTMEGDGATVIKRPFLNGFVMNGNCYPVVSCIRDCSEHLAQGGSKNCTYIASVFTELVRLYDPKGTDTDIFYFDGAGNVQKAGRLLEAMHPRTTVLYGGEHALALWFSKVARIPVIRVRFLMLFACSFRCTTNLFIIFYRYSALLKSTLDYIM